MQYLCGACGQKVNGDMIVYIDHTEKHVMDLVKHDHPDWVEKDGICKKCLEYYHSELKGGIFGDAACALRRRTARGIVQKVLSIFGKKNAE